MAPVSLTELVLLLSRRIRILIRGRWIDACLQYFCIQSRTAYEDGQACSTSCVALRRQCQSVTLCSRGRMRIVGQLSLTRKLRSGTRQKSTFAMAMMLSPACQWCHEDEVHSSPPPQTRVASFTAGNPLHRSSIIAPPMFRVFLPLHYPATFQKVQKNLFRPSNYFMSSHSPVSLRRCLRPARQMPRNPTAMNNVRKDESLVFPLSASTI